MRLNVCEFHSEELFRTLYGKLFRTVDELASAVVTLAGIALRVFVGVKAARRRHYRGGNYVLAGDEFEIVLLTVKFLHHGIIKFAVHGFDASEVYHTFSFCDVTGKSPRKKSSPHKRALLYRFLSSAAASCAF